MNTERENKYLEYLEGHISNVCEALELLIKIDSFVEDNKDKLRLLVSEHDSSKYEEPEWTGYLNHWYPENKEDSLKTEEYDNACKHHIQNNPHHWNYWIDEENNLIEDINKQEYLLYCVERVCDWMAMSIQNNNNLIDWYSVNRDTLVMPEYCFELIDRLIKEIPKDFDLSFHGNRSDGKSKQVNESVQYISPDFLVYQTKEYGDFINNHDKNRIEIFKNVLKNKEDDDYYCFKYEDISKPIVVKPEKKDGKYVVYDGNHRLAAYKQLGIDKVPYVIKEDIGLDRDYIKTLGSRARIGNNGTAVSIKVNSGVKKKSQDERFMKDNINNNKKEKVNQNIKETVKCNIKNVLNESTIKQLYNKSKSEDPARYKKSRNVDTKYIGMSKFGILNFKTTSESRSGYHYQTIEFQDLKPFEDIIKSGKEIMPLDIKKELENQDVNVFCSDESFSYWAWYHYNYKNDSAYIDDNIPDLDKRIAAPKVNNVRLVGSVCKHLMSVFSYVFKPFVMLAISIDMNKYLAGNKEDKMNKQTVATQNWYDAVKQWSSDDATNYLGMSKQQIIADLAKTVKIDKNITLDDYVEDIVNDANKGKEEIEPKLKREIIDKVKDELDLEKEFDVMKDADKEVETDEQGTE